MTEAQRLWPRVPALGAGGAWRDPGQRGAQPVLDLLRPGIGDKRRVEFGVGHKVEAVDDVAQKVSSLQHFDLGVDFGRFSAEAGHDGVHIQHLTGAGVQNHHGGRAVDGRGQDKGVEAESSIPTSPPARRTHLPSRTRRRIGRCQSCGSSRSRNVLSYTAAIGERPNINLEQSQVLAYTF